MINIKEVKQETILDIMKNILENEKKLIKQETMNLISQKSRGDVRAALNDLQTIINLGEEAFISEQTEREKQESIFDALKKVFQSPTEKEITRVYDNTKMDLNEITLWIEENLPLEYKGQALARAHDYLSKADLFKGRIYRQQYWRFLVYQNFFLSAGISASTKLKNNQFAKYKRPTRILKIWISNQKNAKKKSITIKYAKLTHMSKKKANREAFLFPLILSQQAQKKLDLNEKEQEYLLEKRGAIIISSNLNKFKKV